MANIYSNENFPLQAVKALRELGHDVLTSNEAGTANQSIPDESVLVFARAQRRILIIFNRKHFIRPHETIPDHFGIIVCTIDPDHDALANRISEQTALNQPMDRKLIRINRPG